MPAVLQTDKSLSEAGGEGENAVASFHFYLERKTPHCLFVCLFHLHIKQGGAGGGAIKKIDNMWTPAA